MNERSNELAEIGHFRAPKFEPPEVSKTGIHRKYLTPLRIKLKSTSVACKLFSTSFGFLTKLNLFYQRLNDLLTVTVYDNYSIQKRETREI